MQLASSHTSTSECILFIFVVSDPILLLRSIVMSTSVCVCLCVSVHSPRAYLPNHTRDLCQFFACCLWPWLGHPPWGWRNPKEKGQFSGVFFPIDNALYGPYRGANFATKNRFGLNLLIYRSVRKFNLQILKGILLTNYYEITRKVKRETEKFDD